MKRYRFINADWGRRCGCTNNPFIFVCKETEAVQWPKPEAIQSSPQAIVDLISRVLDHAPTANLFEVSINPSLAMDGKDVFKLSNGTRPDSIAITASTGVAAAMGFNYYLKYVAASSGSWREGSEFRSPVRFSLLVGKEYQDGQLEIDSIDPVIRNRGQWSLSLVWKSMYI